MHELQIFNNEEFGQIRTVEIDGEIYFVGKDITEVLGYANASKAITDHVDEEDKLNNESLSSLGQRGDGLSMNPVFIASFFPVRCQMLRNSSVG